MRTVFSILAVLFMAMSPTAASAQAPYVGASLFGEIARTSHAEGMFESNTGSGEALGFALKIGTPVGSTWGVELEFARPSAITNASDVFFPAFAAPLSPEQLAALGAVAPAIYPPIFPIPVALETRDRNTSLSAVLWALQTVTGRVALVYLGGVAFNRFEREFAYAFDFAPALFSRSKSILYGTRPVVGFESWIGLTDRVTLMPGIRLQGIQDGWSVRPAIGIGWNF